MLFCPFKNISINRQYSKMLTWTSWESAIIPSVVLVTFAGMHYNFIFKKKKSCFGPGKSDESSNLLCMYLSIQHLKAEAWKKPLTAKKYIYQKQAERLREKEILLCRLKTFFNTYLIGSERESQYKKKRKISSKPLWIKIEIEIQCYYSNIGNLSSMNVLYSSPVAFFHPLTPFNRQG